MKHYPVMVNNVIKSISQLYLSSRFKVVDCNFGLGGHSSAILKKFPQAIIKAYQLDPKIIKIYQESNPPIQQRNRIDLINSSFSTIQMQKGQGYNVILADLGFNSVQLQQFDGFSWNKNSPLDMRYNPQLKPCHQIINQRSQLQLIQILRYFGDLTIGQANIVTKKILQARPIKTTFQLRDCIVGCFQQNKTKKIAQIFQAFRIATNNQFNDLKILCQKMENILTKNGLCMIITFHSLQRNLIHKYLKDKGKLFSNYKVQKPSKQEIQQNSKSHSAQMISFRKNK